MTHGPEHHLEHAEHAKHAVHDPFDRRVAMTIAIVAAVLACVTMLSHREHNTTLRLQTQVDIQHTKAANEWNYYQAKKNRQYLYEACTDLLLVTAKDPNEPKARTKAAEFVNQWTEKVKKYEHETDEIMQRARHCEEQARHDQEASDHAHHRGARFDFGELGVEMSLVLCSVAVLTKRPGFWYSGMSIGVVGVVTGLSAFLMH